MKTWHTKCNENDDLQILQFGYEPVGTKAKWGPGRRNFYILHYVLEGKGCYNGIPVTKNQGFLISPMASAQYHPDPEDPWKYFWICFDGVTGETICREHIQTDENGIFSYDFRTALTKKICELSEREQNLGQMYALSVFYSIVSNHEKHEPRKNLHVDEAVRFINLNFHRSLTVGEIAHTCGIDDRYLYNLFVKHLGTSPKKYLNKIRIQNAKQLLRDSNCTVTEVAVSVGFEDVLAFSRFFAIHTGMSPTAYRRGVEQFDF